MPGPSSIADHIQLLRSRVARYRVLAEELYDRRIAAEVVCFARELEDELARLERWQHSHLHRPGKTGTAMFAS